VSNLTRRSTTMMTVQRALGCGRQNGRHGNCEPARKGCNA
jgi:hypothetical protein